MNMNRQKSRKDYSKKIHNGILKKKKIRKQFSRKMREIDLLIRIFILVEAGEPEAHDGAGGGHHHVAGRELNTFHGRLVVPIQRTYLHKIKV